MPRPSRRKRVLFVDDEKYVHYYEKDISKLLGLKPEFASSPEHAKRIIALRLAAAERLSRSKQKQLEKANDPKEKNLLKRQLQFLEQMKKKPFDLVVSDINMPRYNPTGVKFAGELLQEHPKQKILIHSDDLQNMLLLYRRHGIPRSTKMNFRMEALLKRAIKRQLSRKKNRQNKK